MAAKRIKNPWSNDNKTATKGNSMGMGNNFGTGVKNPVGRMRSRDSVGFNRVSPKGLKIPPKSLA